MATEDSAWDWIRVAALASVMKPDGDYWLRHIFRWYSEKFHTPLHAVADLPVEDVLMHYYECQFESMSEEQRDIEREKILETPEALARRKREEDFRAAEAEEFAAIANELVGAKPDPNAKIEGTVKPRPDFPLSKMAESSLPDAPLSPLEPDVKIEFVDPDFLEDEMEGFDLMEQPKKPGR